MHCIFCRCLFCELRRVPRRLRHMLCPKRRAEIPLEEILRTRIEELNGYKEATRQEARERATEQPWLSMHPNVEAWTKSVDALSELVDRKISQGDLPFWRRLCCCTYALEDKIQLYLEEIHMLEDQRRFTIKDNLMIDVRPVQDAAPPEATVQPQQNTDVGSTGGMFRLEDLEMATKGFAKENFLGKGGFGDVHKGVLLDGREVAIKQLRSNSTQGEREFEAEVETISRVHHRHLVSLVGYCKQEKRRLLVYEFISNGTLESHLHSTGRPPMELDNRMKVALGSAKGLAYLHEDCNPRIIHRDIKAANILIDSNFDAKVADFGLAKPIAEFETHVSTAVKGTIGYFEPEYALTGRLTEKSDVYSYGVILLELITGKRPVITMQGGAENIVDWVKPSITQALESNNYEDIVDPRLKRNYDRDQMYRLINCAAACTRRSAKKRPKMSQVVKVIEGGVSVDELHQGLLPGHSTIYGSSSAMSLESGEDNIVRPGRAHGVRQQSEGGSSDYYTPGDSQMPNSGV